MWGRASQMPLRVQRPSLGWAANEGAAAVPHPMTASSRCTTVTHEGGQQKKTGCRFGDCAISTISHHFTESGPCAARGTGPLPCLAVRAASSAADPCAGTLGSGADDACKSV